jgi:hypothetical protein
MREVLINVPVVDQFAAFENDGWNKRTGLVQPADFVEVVWNDAVVSAQAVTITEIGTSGEYAVSFTPNAAGLWVVQILVDFNKVVKREKYVAVTTLTNDAARKLDQVATIGPAAATTGSLLDRLCNADASKTYNQEQQSLEGLRRRIG